MCAPICAIVAPSANLRFCLERENQTVPFVVEQGVHGVEDIFCVPIDDGQDPANSLFCYSLQGLRNRRTPLGLRLLKHGSDIFFQSHSDTSVAKSYYWAARMYIFNRPPASNLALTAVDLRCHSRGSIG